MIHIQLQNKKKKQKKIEQKTSKMMNKFKKYIYTKKIKKDKNNILILYIVL